MIATIYNSATGEISAVISSGREEIINLNTKDSESWIEGEAPKDTYVNLSTLSFIDRPRLPEPSENYDLTALPSGTIVKITDSLGTEYEITDLTESLILEGPETYAFHVDPPFPYSAIRTTVEVI